MEKSTRRTREGRGAHGRRGMLAGAAAALMLVVPQAGADPQPGSFDRSFGGDGTVRVSYGRDAEFGEAVAIQKDGKIVVAGSTGDRLAVARLLPNGQPDTSFDDDGKATDVLPGDPSVSDVDVAPDGKIVITGGLHTDGTGPDTHDFYVARFTARGRPDLSFGIGGWALADFGGDDRAARVVVRGGKVWLVGTSYMSPSDDYYDGAIARFNSNGTLDTDSDADPSSHWGGDGTVTLTLPEDEGFLGLRFLADNRVMAAGYQHSTSSFFLLARYSMTGELDTAYGTNGSQLSTVVANQDSGTADLIVADDGYITLSTVGSAPDSALYVRRFTKGGTYVEAFGADGLAILDFGDDLDPVGSRLALQPDGKIVVVGYAGDGSTSRLAMARLTRKGEADPDFGVIVRGAMTMAMDVGLQSDGKIVVSGYSLVSSTFRMMVARFHSGACGIVGTKDADVLRGTPAADLICGGRGSDEIFGNGGPDRLVGGDGRDLLDGGSGKDECVGGAGDDRQRSCER